MTLSTYLALSIFALILSGAYLVFRKRRGSVHPFRFGNAKVLCGRDVK